MLGALKNGGLGWGEHGGMGGVESLGMGLLYIFCVDVDVYYILYITL